MEPKKSAPEKKVPAVPKPTEPPTDGSRYCVQCFQPESETFLEVCRLCHRYFCGECGYRASWGRFCTERCARGFFYGEDDDNESEDGVEE